MLQSVSPISGDLVRHAPDRSVERRVGVQLHAVARRSMEGSGVEEER